jgi:hypothetical protein
VNETDDPPKGLAEHTAGNRAIGSESRESGLSGWTIYLDTNGNAAHDAGELFAVTAANGSYGLGGLLPGTYTGAERPQTGWRPTALVGGAQSVALTAAEVRAGLDFGNLNDGGTAPSAPSFSTTALTGGKVGRLYPYDAAATDALLVRPAGMSVDAADGSVVWTPTAEQKGGQDVVLQVHDGHGGIDVQSFNVLVVPQFRPPVITSAPPLLGTVDELYRYESLPTIPTRSRSASRC